jgi:RNA polymerase-associated protein
VRIVLAEKGLAIEIVDAAPGHLPEDLLDLNPYHSVPTLIDRDLVLYESRIICEYLEERFPHPPLMPQDPVSRAQARIMLHRIERDWYGAAIAIDQATERNARPALRRILRDTVVRSADLFKLKPYFLSNEFTMIDATIAPILWRLPHYEVDLPPQAQPILRYAALVFERPGFRASLSGPEQDLRLA